MANVKDYTNVETQIGTMRRRNMVVDEDEARQWLSHVNYFRLSGYWYPFRRTDENDARLDDFEAGTQFHDITLLYEFDRKLRVLVLDALGRVEVALRRALSDHLGGIDPLAYLLPEVYRPEFDHAQWKKQAEKRVDRADRRGSFIAHQRAAYNGIPIWILSEVLDFSDLSILYEGLTGVDQWKVARNLGIDIAIDAVPPGKRRQKAAGLHPLARWLEQLCIVRNVCAHHGRLWNEQFVPASTVFMGKIPALETLPMGESRSLYGSLLVTAQLLTVISPGSSWALRVRELIGRELTPIPGCDAAGMGFPPGWSEANLWNGPPTA